MVRPPFPSSVPEQRPALARLRSAVAAAVMAPGGVAALCCVLIGWIAGVRDLRAQDLQARSSPFSAYLDLRPAPAGAAPQTVPAWIEAFEFLPGSGKEKLSLPAGGSAAPASGGAAGAPASAAVAPLKVRSVFRLRVQRPAGASDDLQMRVFFDDRSPESRPRVTAWDELGTELMRSAPLGQGVGLPTSETLTVPMNGVNYLEIETSDDGTQVRGVFFSWLEKAQIRQPIDFPASEKAAEPFQIVSATRTRAADSYLYGVVTAALQRTPVTMSAAAANANIQFELERQPLVAVVSYEVLGANVVSPPLLRVNGRPAGPLDFTLPDLADPGYQGQAASAEGELSFHYTGWIHAQKVIAGQLLVAGLNELSLGLSSSNDPIAIRSVEIQLKYNWEKLDYVVAPAPAFPAH